MQLQSLLADDYIRVPVLAQVCAGKPAPFDFDEIVAWREVRPLKDAGPYDTFAAVPVCGDSLKDKNIVDGDWLIILYTPRAVDGELVVAITPWGRTVKYLCSLDDDCVLLKGANSDYEDQCWLKEEVRIQGVVKRVERDL
jgi:SOS-response transcriptional repressor LexA